MARNRNKAPSDIAKPAEPAVESRLLERAQAALGVGVETIEAAIGAAAKKVRDGINGNGNEEAGYDKDAASHLAWLTKQAAQIAGEIRKIEAHDQSQLKKLTVATVLEWYKQLSEDERADLQRRFAAVDDGRSILAL